VINVEAVATALAIPLILLVFMLENIIKAWQGGKLALEQEKTKQAELALERSKVDHAKHVS
jgi:hypothetical protein